MINKRPVVWTICFWYPPNFSGRGIQAHREHCEFVKQGIPVTVLTAGVKSAKSLRGKSVGMEGVNVKYIPATSFPMSSLQKNKILFSVRANISSLSFALLCAWTLFWNGQRNDIIRFEAYNRFAIIPMLIALVKGMHPVLRMSLLGSDDPYSILDRAKNGQFMEYLTASSFRATEVIVAICSEMINRCQMANIKKEKIIYLPHGTDIERYQPVDLKGKNKIRQQLELEPHKRYVLFVGSAIFRKGIDVLIDSFIDLRKEINDVELLIVGPNQFDKGAHFDDTTLSKTVRDCKEKLIKTKCDSFVHWIGEVDNVHEYMKAADVFCLPTRKEGFGLVIIEAMASGIPVVVSSLAGVTTDIISSKKVGVLIKGYNSEDYSQVIMDLCINPEKAQQMGRAARARAVSIFSLDNTIHHWIKLFQRLISDKNSIAFDDSHILGGDTKGLK